mmetsp:Transcript_59235/g.142916  ORF Transcript_59235/g.142916 Transcript_59235/m.142916 type:complete len:225 (-) Transcript_59235:84-758(-)
MEVPADVCVPVLVEVLHVEHDQANQTQDQDVQSYSPPDHHGLHLERLPIQPRVQLLAQPLPKVKAHVPLQHQEDRDEEQGVAQEHGSDVVCSKLLHRLEGGHHLVLEEVALPVFPLAMALRGALLLRQVALAHRSFPRVVPALRELDEVVFRAEGAKGGRGAAGRGLRQLGPLLQLLDPQLQLLPHAQHLALDVRHVRRSGRRRRRSCIAGERAGQAVHQGQSG